MRSFWDEAYRRGEHVEHWEDPGPPRHLDALVRRADVAAGGRVLDVGCGGGLDALHLAGLGFAVVGLDVSPAALSVARVRARARAGQRARRRSGSVRWLRASALRLPLADASVDAVHDRGCFHLLEEPATRRRYAAEVARVLGPGGVLLLLGARHDDEARGLVGLDGPAVERTFARSGLAVVERAPVELRAPAGDLPALSLLLRATLSTTRTSAAEAHSL